MKRTMAIDIGDARIGVALTDPLGITSQPHATIERSGRCILALIEIIKAKDVGTVVVGMPYELDGGFGPQARKVQEYATELHQACLRRNELKSVNIVFWDERMSTRAAARVMIGSGLKNKEASAALDQIAAAIVLDAYMSAQVPSHQVAV